MLLAALLISSTVPAFAHGGNEAQFHILPSTEAPTVSLAATPSGSGFDVNVDTTNFTWAEGTEVRSFTAGTGIGWVYFDDIKVGKIFGPKFHVDPTQFDPIPGEHSIFVSLAGEDMVSYAAEGTEVEARVDVDVPPQAQTTTTNVVDDMNARIQRDPFGGFTVSTENGVSVAIDGVPYTRSFGVPVHIAENDRTFQPGPHVVTLSATNSAGESQEVSLDVPAVGDTSIVESNSATSAWEWLLQMYRRHIWVTVT